MMVRNRKQHRTAGCRDQRPPLAATLLWGTTLLVCGCTTSGITGGNIPLGPTKAVTSGHVVAAVQPTQTVAGAAVTLMASDGSTFNTTTDSQGSYSFSSVPIGTGTLIVTPPHNANFDPQTLPVDVAATNSLDSVSVALPPHSGYLQVQSITLNPSSINLSVGGTAAVTATIQGQDVPSGSVPSFTVTGGVGSITPTGQFTATHSGSGTLTATAGSIQTSIPIQVQ